ncbi:serine palmitoyltransferase component, partial [Quaeritorhiza haematococci]
MGKGKRAHFANNVEESTLYATAPRSSADVLSPLPMDYPAPIYSYKSKNNSTNPSTPTSSINGSVVVPNSQQTKSVPVSPANSVVNTNASSIITTPTKNASSLAAAAAAAAAVVSPKAKAALKAKAKQLADHDADYYTTSSVEHHLADDDENQNETHVIESAPLFTLVTTYLSYFILILYGHVRDFFGMRLRAYRYAHLKKQKGYAPLNSGFDTFYQRRLYCRIRDVFNRPVTNVAGRKITLLERESDDFNKTFRLTGKTREVLNLSSYNYLGFAQNEGPCADAVERKVRECGIASSGPRLEAGTTDLALEVESLVARFIGHESAMVVSMGFATNSTTLPALVSKGCLIISDELNHASLVYGARVSGATIRVFKHNDSKDLEAVLRECIAHGQPRTRRPWKKILVVVEGLYSMEGTLCCLPEIMALKKKYKFYLYLDEAHSIGAIGPNGRGVCDYYGIDPKDVDIMMGTFTKSFGSAGGYICGTKAVVDQIRFHCQANVYAEAVSVPVLQQIWTSMRIIM